MYGNFKLVLAEGEKKTGDADEQALGPLTSEEVFCGGDTRLYTVQAVPLNSGAEMFRLLGEINK